VPPRRLVEEPGLGLAALALISVIVVTDQDFIQGQFFHQGFMDGFHDFSGLLAPGNIGLIGNPD
jgi:hypothetical protein